MIGRARNLLGFNRNVLEKTEPVHPVARQLYPVGVIPGRLELAKFTPHHFVPGSCVARDIDPSDIGAARWCGLQHQRDPVVDAVDFRPGFHLRERIAKISEIVREGLGRLRHFIGVIGLAGTDRHQRLELVILAQVTTFKFDARHDVLLTLGHIDRDVDTLLVRGNDNLGRVDTELEVTTRQIVGTQGLDIRIQLGARILVGLGVPTEPATGVKVEQVAQCRFAEDLVADNTDLLDLGPVTLANGKVQIDPVTFDRRHGGHDVGGIQAAVDVLALELLLGPVQHRAIERAAIGQPDVAQGVTQHILVELLVATELDLGNRGAFLDDHHQHISAHLDPDVLEQPKRKNSLNGGSAFFIVVRISNTHRQGRKNSPGLNPLQTLDPDVANLEWLDGPS